MYPPEPYPLSENFDGTERVHIEQPIGGPVEEPPKVINLNITINHGPPLIANILFAKCLSTAMSGHLKNFSPWSELQ